MVLIQQIQIELLGPVNFYVGMGLKIFSAILLGGIIGLDRESKHKSAGFKTHILICIGATLYTAISLINLSVGGQNADPNRVAAQVVSGIGFLGAGAIFRGGGSVTGLTTAAGIWVVAAVGVAIGSGYIVSATIFTFTVLIVLKILDPLHRYLRPELDYFFEVVGTTASQEEVIKLTEKMCEQIYSYEIFEDSVNKSREISHLYIKISPKKVKLLVRQMKAIHKVELINYRLLKEIPEFDARKV